jgi:hypothetical protein
MRDAEPVRHLSRVVDVLARTAASGALHRRAVIVELQRHPDHFGAAARGQRGNDRTVDAARHGDDDPRAPCRPAKLEVHIHRRST